VKINKNHEGGSTKLGAWLLIKKHGPKRSVALKKSDGMAEGTGL
jgi:hypothetical protein